MIAPIALLGGTFDPIHDGHLRAAIEIQEALQAKELRLIPCAIPPHRAQPGATAEQRVSMIEAAIAGTGPLRCDTRELSRSGPSYTIDTLHSFRAEFGSLTPLVLVLGADAFHGLPSWNRWRELPELAHIAVLTRPDSQGLIDPRLEEMLAERATALPSDLAQSASGRVLRLEIPPLPISSTLIRARVKQRRCIRFLVPDPVIDFINQQALYRG